METESEVLAKLVAHKRESIAFFSNARKREREQVAARALLRLLSVKYSEAELRALPEEPIDVRVAGAAFQITEVTEPERRRHLEQREELDRYSRGKSLRELMEPVVPAVPSSITPRHISRSEMLSHVQSALDRKQGKYGAAICRGLDALVYLNLRAAVLEHQVVLTGAELSSSTPWRSVSLLTGNGTLVLAAERDAPTFLRRYASRPGTVWPTPWGLWEP